MLPFTMDEFFAVFAAYNDAVWPTQILAYVLGLVAVSLIFFRRLRGDLVISAVLAAMWLWTGIAYHIVFFAPINGAAYLFGALFLVQGLLFLVFGVFSERLRLAFDGSFAAWVGLAFVAYAAIAYPLIGQWTGHAYPRMPMFGITPCPVTIFTFGMMLLAGQHYSRWLLVIPLLWSLIGGSAAFMLGVIQDWPLLFSGLIAVALIEYRKRQTRSAGSRAR